jgi:hypothetical protein
VRNLIRTAAELALLGGVGFGLSSACGASTIVTVPDNAGGSAGSGGAGVESTGAAGTGGTVQATTGGGAGAVSTGAAGTAGTGGAGTGGGGVGDASAGSGGAPADAGVDAPVKTYTLTVTKTGSGKVTSTPVGDIDCGATCSKMYPSTTATMVSLTATPDSMIQFAGWGGDCAGTGACMVTMSADHTVSAAFKDCRPASLSATQYVDHASGTDDAAHGGATGTCAYKTLTYALAHSTGSVQLVGTDTFPGGVVGESAPYTLGTAQKLFCNNAKFTWPTASGSYSGLVGMAGTANTIDGCRLDGATNGGYCAVVSTTGTHTFSNNTVTNCGNVAVDVALNVSGITLIGNTFTANYSAIHFEGTNGGTLTNNSIVSTGTIDVYCASPSDGLTGSGNTRGAGTINCTGCTHCPF